MYLLQSDYSLVKKCIVNDSSKVHVTNWSDEYKEIMKKQHKRRVSGRRKKYGVVWVVVNDRWKGMVQMAKEK